MAIIVAFDEKGRPQYRGAAGLAITAEERARADRLDLLIREVLAKFLKDMKRRGLFSEKSKGGGDLYWELGRVISQIERESRLVDRQEHDMFLANCKLHLPPEIVKSDRDTGRRDHLQYCLRLGNYSKEQMQTMNWGEWSYLFDSTNDTRFDVWLQTKISKNSSDFKRESIRTFRQVITALLGNVETSHLDDQELFRCYEASWSLRGALLKNKIELDKTRLKSIVKETTAGLAGVMSGTNSPDTYASDLVRILQAGAL